MQNIWKENFPLHTTFNLAQPQKSPTQYTLVQQSTGGPFLQFTNKLLG